MSGDAFGMTTAPTEALHKQLREEARTKPKDKTPLVSVLIPSRNRLDLLESCVKSWKTLAANPDDIEIIVRLHLSDSESMAWAVKRPYSIQVVAGEDYNLHASMSTFVNCLAACSTGDWLMPVSDDFECLTKGWDNALHAVSTDPRNQYLIKHFEVLNKPEARPPIISRAFYHAIGCWGHTDFADVYVDSIGWKLGINRMDPLPVKIRDRIGPHADPQQNWEQGYKRFYDPYIQKLLDNDFEKLRMLIGR